MRPTAIALLSVIALPNVTFAQADDIVIADLIAAVTANGCQMTEDEADPLLDPLRHSQDAIRAAAESLAADGRATFSEGDDTFALTEAVCVPDGDGPAQMPDETALIEMIFDIFRANDCTITEDQLMTGIAASGVAMEDLEQIAPEMQALEDSGKLVESEDGLTVTLSDDLCREGADTPDAPGPDARAALLAALAANDCRLSEDEAPGILPDFGITMDAAEPIASDLIAEGLAVFQDGDLILAPSVCMTAAAQP
jgi:hypothetical protein